MILRLLWSSFPLQWHIPGMKPFKHLLATQFRVLLRSIAVRTAAWNTNNATGSRKFVSHRYRKVNHSILSEGTACPHWIRARARMGHTES